MECQDVHWARVTRQEIEQIFGFLKSNRWFCFQLLLSWKYDAMEHVWALHLYLWIVFERQPYLYLIDGCAVWKVSCSQLELIFPILGWLGLRVFARTVLLLNLLFQGSWCRLHCRLSICSNFGWLWQILYLRRAGLLSWWCRNFGIIFELIFATRFLSYPGLTCRLIHRDWIYERKCEKGAKLYEN